MAPTSPTVAAWALGLRLREKRTEAGLSGGKAAERIGTAAAYLSDVEHGKKTVAADRLDKMIAAYDFNDDEADELRALREDATGRGWWTKYSALFSEDLLRFFGFEHGAESICSYEGGVVHGMLQTEAYAQAIIEAGQANLRMAEVERRVHSRMLRRSRLGGDDPLRLTAIMSEAVLQQAVGGVDVLRDQLNHLVDVIDKHSESVQLHIIPFDAGGHPALGASTFHLMTFPSARLPTLLWQESVTSTQLIMDGLTAREYQLAFHEAAKLSLSREDSLRLIKSSAGLL
ncbi:helix-turn-helix transcriptional regulator [Saccharopolyspora gloriosae]|uniref:helix-turn-helix domain-containing protein n=1 Tax=Saccharopolyspora gloriosae TaxID=455344 RepID=UPI001FB6C0ED|nr:helix-turn-helix transcriptional regulator [Saccharopolyspora gloriosae]